MKLISLLALMGLICAFNYAKAQDDAIAKLMPVGGHENDSKPHSSESKSSSESDEKDRKCTGKPVFTGCKEDFIPHPKLNNAYFRCSNGYSICMKCAPGTIYQFKGHCVFTDCSNDPSKKCENGGKCVEKKIKGVIYRYCECPKNWQGFRCEIPKEVTTTTKRTTQKPTKPKTTQKPTKPKTTQKPTKPKTTKKTTHKPRSSESNSRESISSEPRQN